jgi:hypothetical protein
LPAPVVRHRWKQEKSEASLPWRTVQGKMLENRADDLNGTRDNLVSEKRGVRQRFTKWDSQLTIILFRVCSTNYE